MASRVQLSLFVPPTDAEPLERARRLLDPVQASLIPAHVTLCREDELDGIDLPRLGSLIASSGVAPIRLTFGAPEYFHDHGVWLPCVDGEEQFHEARCSILGSRAVRRHAPHLTLAHPRNPRAPQNIPANLHAVPAGLVLTFAMVHHIQQDGVQPWRVIGTHALAARA
jgi:2'-5' RNA ligase